MTRSRFHSRRFVVAGNDAGSRCWNGKMFVSRNVRFCLVTRWANTANSSSARAVFPTAVVRAAAASLEPTARVIIIIVCSAKPARNLRNSCPDRTDRFHRLKIKLSGHRVCRTRFYSYLSCRNTRQNVNVSSRYCSNTDEYYFLHRLWSFE